MAALAELAEHGIVGSADVLPMPVGPQQPPFPPAPETFEEKLRQDVARLQGLLAEAVRDAHRARSERDLIRERVSEPFGCTHCGVEKRSHGRRYLGGQGVHAWERPSDAQVKGRMLARRAARFTPHAESLAKLLVARTEDLSGAEARIAELENERHSTNEALDDAVQALRANRDEAAEEPYVSRLLPPRAAVCARCGHSGEEHHHGDTKCWAHLPRVRQADLTWSGATICECSAFVAGPSVEVSADKLTALFAPTQALREDPHDSPLHHDYRISHDLPESGGAR
jgi:hypothetical protein